MPGLAALGDQDGSCPVDVSVLPEYAGGVFVGAGVVVGLPVEPGASRGVVPHPG